LYFGGRSEEEEGAWRDDFTCLRLGSAPQRIEHHLTNHIKCMKKDVSGHPTEFKEKVLFLCNELEQTIRKQVEGVLQLSGTEL